MMQIVLKYPVNGMHWIIIGKVNHGHARVWTNVKPYPDMKTSTLARILWTLSLTYNVKHVFGDMEQKQKYLLTRSGATLQKR